MGTLTGIPARSIALQRRPTDESSGIVGNSRVRAPPITGELIVYEIELRLQADNFRKKQDNRTVGRG